MRLDIDANAPVGGLPIVMQQMVAAIKAMVHEAKLVIMDEPSSSLTNKELHTLFGLIRRLKQHGIAVIYVSHRLEEIFQICDSVTVLLNGRMVSTSPVGETTKDKVVTEMIGKTVVETRLNPRDSYDGERILEVDGLSYRNILRDVSFSVKKGEIYGILGLMGSGAVSLGKLLYGILRPDGGEMRVNGRTTRFRSPADALANSIAYVSDDRRAYGIFREMDVEKNSMISSYNKFLSFRPLRIMDKPRIREMFSRYVEKFGTKISGPEQRIRLLSGGNQQKILIARALISNTDVIILSSPTKGIDVGAKFEIYQILLDCAKQGKTVIVVSQEITELVQICDRILMLKQGRVFREYQEDTLSESLIYSELLR
jgi:ribose transport system ATP-binding protein